MSGLSPVHINLLLGLILENIILGEELVSLFSVLGVRETHECECLLDLRVFLYQQTGYLCKYMLEEFWNILLEFNLLFKFLEMDLIG